MQNLIINEHSGGGGGINLTVVYAEGSLSPGALVCVIPILIDSSLGLQQHETDHHTSRQE